MHAVVTDDGVAPPASAQQPLADAALARSQELLNMASRVGRLGAWQLELPGYTIDWTEELRSIFEVSEDFAPTLDKCLAFLVEDDRQIAIRAVENCVCHGQPFDEEVRLVTAQGNHRWVRGIGEAMRDPQGNVVRVQGALQDITDRKASEQREAQLTAQLTQALESISDAFCTLDHAWKFTYLNAQAERVLVRSRQDLLGRSLWGEFPEARNSTFEMQYRRAMERMETVEFEEYYPPLEAWLAVRAYPMSTGIAIYFRDVTEARAARETIAASEARFREMAENIEEVFYNYDVAQHRMLYVSPAFERIWGCPIEVLATNPLAYLDTVHPDDRAAAETIQQQQFAGIATEIQYRIVRPDGEVRWIVDRTYPVFDASGRVNRIVGTARDITEQTRIDETLRVSEERFRLLAKATNDAIWDWNLATDTLWWNEGYETLFGYQLDEISTTINDWIAHIHPLDRQAVTDSIHNAIDAGHSDWTSEYRFIRQDGSHAYVLDRGHVLRDAGGKPIRMVGGMTDLTERRQLEERLRQSQKMEAVGCLAGGVAHDFNNLLMVIMGDAELLLSSTPEGYPDRKLLADICEASRRAATLTRQLLAFSRKQVLAPRVLDLNEVVRNTERMLRRLIGEDIELTSQLAPVLPHVRVDPGQLEQVIMNLAVNARDAMPGGGRLIIETSFVAPTAAALLGPSPTSYVALAISDTGLGMTKAVQARVFEPFFTTKGPGHGTGLGLATVFGIVEQSGGVIEVESEPGAGTRFRILFPTVSDQQSHAPPLAIDAPTGRETILLVEDEAAVRRIVKRGLEQQGYSVLEANCGRQAIELFQTTNKHIDLVITDVVMPGMHGRELVETLRRTDPHLKLLFVSGYTDDAVVRRGVSDQEDAFLQKPFSSQALANKVREVLDQQTQVPAGPA